ncbi:hypothetical protein PIB30_022353 [Stylosanthes scabra]|uniref:Uncharacterized protein n=1 Tax=Stylosanthes scabra TaxID=79078 RepID=A0ABU6WA45_9FABA|nr:hypothetical protein [Stylosanthes scabra]
MNIDDNKFSDESLECDELCFGYDSNSDKDEDKVCESTKLLDCRYKIQEVEKKLNELTYDDMWGIEFDTVEQCCESYRNYAKDYVCSIATEDTESENIAGIRYGALATLCFTLCESASKNRDDFMEIRDDIFGLIQKLKNRHDPNSKISELYGKRTSHTNHHQSSDELDDVKDYSEEETIRQSNNESDAHKAHHKSTSDNGVSKLPTQKSKSGAKAIKSLIGIFLIINCRRSGAGVVVRDENGVITGVATFHSNLDSKVDAKSTRSKKHKTTVRPKVFRFDDPKPVEGEQQKAGSSPSGFGQGCSYTLASRSAR